MPDNKKKNTPKAKVIEGAVLAEQEGQSSSEIDYERYESLFNSSDLSVDQKREYIDFLWAVAVDFVSLAHNQHPVQAVIASFFETADLETCGQTPENRPKRPLGDSVRAIFNPESHHSNQRQETNSVHHVNRDEEDSHHGT